MKIREIRVSRSRTLILLASAIAIIACLLFANWNELHAALTAKTWDGGGMTNNWSEAANWSDDIVPGSGDIVTFDATSTKNATIDTDITVAAINIAAGYSGTITQSNSAAITISGCPGRTCFVQDAGTFNGSSNTITINSGGFGDLTLHGGAFNGGSGDIALLGSPGLSSNLLLQGGTFTSTSGNLTILTDLVFQGSGTTFLHNNGKVTFNGSQSGFLNADGFHPTISFHDVEVNLSSGASYTFLSRAIVEGSLQLTDGSIEQNGSIVESRGSLTIAPTFDGGSATLEIANGTGTRVFTFDASLNLPRVVVNDPNITINTSGSGTLSFPHSFVLQQGLVNQGNVDLLFGPRPGGGFCYTQSGGIFNGSSKTITVNSNGFGGFNQSGGSFTAGSGDISMTGSSADLTVSGGTFTSTSGTLTASASFRIQGGIFNHNNGTVTFTGGGSPTIDVTAFAAGLVFKNVSFNRDNGTGTFLFGTLITTGTLSLTDGGFTNNGIIEVRSVLNIANTFDGGGPSNLLLANGSGPRTFVLDTSYTLPLITLNDPNVTLNTSGTGTLNFPRAFVLQQGIFNQGNVDLDFFPFVGGGSSFTQSGGTFNGSTKTVTFTSDGFGGFSQSGGTFNAGTGDITLNGTGSSFTVSGGTFNSTPGLLTIPSDFRINGAGAIFNHNNGTVTFSGGGSPSIDISAVAAGLVLKNVNFNRDNGSGTFLFGKMITIGALSLIEGGFTNNGILEVRAGLSIASTFDGGGPNNLLIANGSGPRTFTFDTSLTLPFVTLDDPNVTLNTSGSGTLNWPRGFRLQRGTFNQGNVDLAFFPVPGGSFTPYSQSGGTFNGSSNSIFATGNGFGGFSQSGGVFNSGSGDITLNGTGSSFTLSGGTFNSTPGILTIPADFRINSAGAVFNHNNGTVTFSGGGSPSIDISAVAAGLVLKNVNFNRDNGSGTFLFGKMITIGALSLIEGGFTNNGILEVRAGLSIASTFDGGGPNNLLIANGSGPRTFTFDTSLTLPFVTLDDPNVTLNTSGSGTLNWPRGFRLQRGTFNQGNVDLAFFPVPGGSFTPYSQSGGTFNGSSNSIFATGNGFGGFSQSGGVFNSGIGDITLNGTGSSFTLSGGTFSSTPGILTIPADFRINSAGAVFNHNNGKVTFTGGGSPSIDISAVAAGLVLKNVNFNRDNGSGTFLFGKMVTLGTLSLNDGGFTNNGIVEAQGDVNIAATFDGGGPNEFTFSGAVIQTFTNNGGPNPPGIWTLNKTGGTVNLASNLDLSNGPSNSLNLTAGTISTGNFEVNAGTRTIGRTAGYISGNLRRDFSTTGIKTYDVGTANSYAPVSVNVIALLSGTQGLTVGEFQGAHPNLDPAISLGRFWTLVEHGTVTANLTFNYIDPLDIHGSETAYRVAQIDSNVNFFTDAQIPINRTANSFSINNVTDFKSYTLGQPTVTISPANISLQVQGTQTFTGSGGTAPYSYIMAGNSSFGSVNPTTGLYTAGTHAGGQDSVKVTDSEGRIAFATINVTPGAAAKLGFGVPLNTVNINSPISPPPMFVIQDQFGNPVTTATDPVTISITNNPGGGTLSGTLTQNAVNGVVTFSDLSIDVLGNGYTLTAGSGSLTPATTNPFNVLGPAQLAFINEQAPTPIIQNTQFSLQVEVRDQFGARFTNAVNPVTLAILNNPGGGTLSGATTQNAANGVVFFSGLSIDAPGSGYTFTAASPTLTPATSLSYNIVSPTVVTNKTDGLPGSLRSAIIAANAAPGTQTISFNIPGPAPYGIVLSTPLPAITDAVVIDGTTQPGFAGSPVIEIDGRNLVGNVSGIALQASNSKIKGLSVTRFSNSQFSSGITVSSQANNNTIQGNWIGVSPSGAAASNGNGVAVASRDNLIGGPNGPDRNVISGNLNFGLEFGGANKPNTVQGNYIGTNAAGSSAIGNKIGINMSGSCTVRDNVISGNLTDGLIGTGDPNNLIQNNLIGLDATGSTSIGNGGSGINFSQTSGFGNRITGNRIFGNGLLGIKLGNRTVTAAGPALPNDPLDPDTGPNNLQNYPVLTSVLSSAGSTAINGTLNSTPSSTYTLEFFSNPACDASGNGEGETILGTANTNTDANGNATFSISLPVTISNTRFVTATATDASGNTSEFSACKGPSAAIHGTVKTAGGQPILGVSVKLNNSSNGTVKFGTTDSLGAYQFNEQPLGQNYTVTPSKVNLIFSPPSVTHNNLVADQNDAFVGAVQTFTISGKATLSGATLSGVTMTLSGGANATTPTDSIGNYSFPNLPAGTYTVTPSLQNFSFSPASSTFTISGSQAANFAATNLLANLPGKIAFVSSGGISRMNADGSGVTLIIPNTRAFTYLSPALSKNGSKLAYIEHTVGGTNANTLKVSNADGSSPVSLTQLDSGQSNFGLAWSPDQTIVTACKTVNGVVRLINVTVATGTVTSIVTTGTTNEQPVWSPDGSKIALSRDDATTGVGGRAIFTVNANGTGLVKLTSPLIVDSLPTWSPDGTKIAFIRSLSGVNTEVFVMNADGSGQTDVFSVPLTEQLSDVEWAPDGSRLAVITRSGTAQRLVTIPDGSPELVISSNLGGTAFDWGPSPFVLLPIGTGVNINIGRVGLNFPSVPLSGAGSPTLTVEPIAPASLGDPPPGFVFGNFGYDISTDGTFTPPVGVCFDLPPDAYPDASSFNELSLLHFENGLFTDVTSSRDLAHFRLCGQSGTLGTFVVAEHANSSLPSISGIVVDQNGNPVDDITLSLTGDSEHQATTGSDGAFRYVNLVPGGNYVLTPITIGRIYNAPFAGFLSLNGERIAVFVATPATFGISGNITDQSLLPAAGVTVNLSGTADDVTTTDANGNYNFPQLPASGTYVVTPSVEGSVFFPDNVPVSSLQDDLRNVNFQEAAFSQGPFSIGGRIVGQNGNGLSQVSVVLTGSEFSPLRTTKTNPFGYYRFDNVPGSQSYTVSVSSKRFDFANPSQVINVVGDLTDVNFVGSPR